MTNRTIPRSWVKNYKLSYQEAILQFNKLANTDRPICERESGYVQRLSHRAIYQRYISVTDAFLDEYLRIKTDHPNSHFDQKLTLLNKCFNLFSLLANSRREKRYMPFYKEENSFYIMLCVRRDWFKEEMDKYSHDSSLNSEPTACCLIS